MKTTSICIPKHRNYLSDFLAACLLLSRYPEIVRVRRSATPEAGEATIGLSPIYNPTILHFGQPPAEQLVGLHEPLTPLGRVLQHVGAYQNAGITWPWLYPLELREALGTTEISDHLNCSAETITRLSSPLDAIIMQEFQTFGVLDESVQLFQQMIYIGDSLWRQLGAADAMLNEVRDKHRVLDVDGIKVLWFQDLEGDQYESIISRFVMLEARDISVSIKPDTKGSGWALFKFRSSPVMLDLRQLSGHPEIAYCQTRGALVKTKTRCDEAVLRQIINRSRIR